MPNPKIGQFVGVLTHEDHVVLDDFLKLILKAQKEDKIDSERVRSEIVQIMGGLDKRNKTEYHNRPKNWKL